MVYQKLQYLDESEFFPDLIDIAAMTLVGVCCGIALILKFNLICILFIVPIFIVFLLVLHYSSRKADEAKEAQRLRNKIVAAGQRYVGKIIYINVRPDGEGYARTLVARYINPETGECKYIETGLLAEIPEDAVNRKCLIYVYEWNAVVDGIIIEDAYERIVPIRTDYQEKPSEDAEAAKEE